MQQSKPSHNNSNTNSNTNNNTKSNSNSNSKVNKEQAGLAMKRRQYMGDNFDKYDYVLKNLLPLKQKLQQKYLPKHNQYLLNILQNKIQCYKAHSTDALAYYKCYQKVEQMVGINYTKLRNQCYKINSVLDSCLKRCSIDSNTNEEFLGCAEGERGCFGDWRKTVGNMYGYMYHIILEKPK